MIFLERKIVEKQWNRRQYYMKDLKAVLVIELAIFVFALKEKKVHRKFSCNLL